MECVLFDLDGTIAETEILKAKALSQAICILGGNSPPEIYKNVMGKNWEVVTNTFLVHSNLSSTLQELNPLFKESYTALIESDLVDSRGSTGFIEWFKTKGFKIGLVSSASPWMIEKTLAQLNLQNSFDVIVSGADISEHKPNPEAYLLALSKLNTKPEASIAFEDSESGFQAAAAAGIKVFGIRHSYNDLHDFALCHRVLSSFDEYMNAE